jgi:hypothetical protein
MVKTRGGEARRPPVHSSGVGADPSSHGLKLGLPKAAVCKACVHSQLALGRLAQLSHLVIRVVIEVRSRREEAYDPG